MTWWHYLLLANVYLTLFFVFYTLFLRRETFFNLNRVYLVSGAILSFLLPIVQPDRIKHLFITQKVKETIYHVGPAVYQFTARANAIPQHQLTLGQIICGLYLSGILVLTIRFFYQLAVLNWVMSQRKTETTFSFFNQIKVEERDTDNYVITAHEQAHARQWHSADILLLEAIMIINWFNPVVYWYRNAVKHIHEFIADRDALKDGSNKAEYAMLLLSQTFTTPPYHLVNPFFTHSLLKQRILMLNKNKSQRIKLIKYGLSAPLFALMLILSSATVNQSKAIQDINHGAGRVFSTPAGGFNGSVNGVKMVNVDYYPDGGNISETDRTDLFAVIKQHAAALGSMKISNKVPQAGDPAHAGEAYTEVEHNASFPGGIGAFNEYLSDNIRYPEEARQKNLQGKVYATFVVEKDGRITGIRILHSIGGGTDEETIKLLSKMPNWEPGVQNGHTIRQQFTVPITFALTDSQGSVTGRNSDDQSELFTAVENSAEFPGGIEGFHNYLSRVVRYPTEARQKNIQGKVFVTFIVEKDGSLTDIKLLRGIGGGADEEAIRVLNASPKWAPATQNGRVVRQQFTVPISFVLQDARPAVIKAEN